MDQTLLTNPTQLFFMKLGTHLFPVAVTLFPKELTIASDAHETYVITYHRLFAVRMHPDADTGIHTLSLLFYQRQSTGIVFRCQTTRLSSLTLYSKDLHKIQTWHRVFQNATHNSDLDPQLIEALKSDSVTDLKGVTLEDEKISTKEEESKETSLYQEVKFAKHFLVFVNPASGKVTPIGLHFLPRATHPGSGRRRWRCSRRAATRSRWCGPHTRTTAAST